MADTPAGLQVNFFNYKDNFPFGSVGSAANMEAGCAVEDNFFFTTVASGLDRTKVHSIRVVMNLFDGPRNDVVRVYVDGILRHVDTSWEGYFRWCEATGVSRTVDSVLFRTGGVAVPATTGKGFLIDNFGETTTNSYSCVGFEPPMDKDIIAKKKGNKVLPLKMVCKDAYGIVVGPALISPPVVQVTKVGLGDATDPVDVFLSAGQGSEGNEFEFDPLTGKWQFNLQTKNFTGVGVYDITAVPGGADVIVSAPTATFVIQ